MLEDYEESLEKIGEIKKLALEQYLYYTIIFIASLISLVFLPMVGSVVGAGFKFPTTKLGWAIYITTKLYVAGLNLLIFHCFIKQGKVNARNDKNYLEACAKLNKVDRKINSSPRSPQKFLSGEYGKKGATIFLCTCLSLVVLTQAVLTFDWISLVTYLVTIVMGVVFGVMEMVKVKNYWITEYVLYADKMYMKEFGTDKPITDAKTDNSSKTLSDVEIVAKLLLPQEVKK